jgi:26S proteasome regulatory subunit N10
MAEKLSPGSFLLRIELMSVLHSHYIEVAAGPHLLSDLLLSSALVAGEAGIGGTMQALGGAGGVGAGGGFEFGFDPAMDPELALAMRLSLEESQRNQAQAEGTAPQPSTENKPAATSETKRKSLDLIGSRVEI